MNGGSDSPLCQCVLLAAILARGVPEITLEALVREQFLNATPVHPRRGQLNISP